MRWSQSAQALASFRRTWVCLELALHDELRSLIGGKGAKRATLRPKRTVATLHRLVAQLPQNGWKFGCFTLLC